MISDGDDDGSDVVHNRWVEGGNASQMWRGEARYCLLCCRKVGI